MSKQNLFKVREFCLSPFFPVDLVGEMVLDSPEFVG